jgi:aspartyl-tRNA(Asn)/glutamyl-tRNA(Gln) amidotransferase subunit A
MMAFSMAIALRKLIMLILLSFYSVNRAEALGSEVRNRIMLGTFALSSGFYDAWYLKAQKVRS